MHLAYIWIVCHLSAKNYQNRWKFDAVLTKTNLLSFFETRCTRRLPVPFKTSPSIRPTTTAKAVSAEAQHYPIPIY